MYIKYSTILSLCLFIPEFKIKQQKKIHFADFVCINQSFQLFFLCTLKQHEKQMPCTNLQMWICCNYIYLYLMTRMILFWSCLLAVFIVIKSWELFSVWLNKHKHFNINKFQILKPSMHKNTYFPWMHYISVNAI